MLMTTMTIDQIGQDIKKRYPTDGFRETNTHIDRGNVYETLYLNIRFGMNDPDYWSGWNTLFIEIDRYRSGALEIRQGSLVYGSDWKDLSDVYAFIDGQAGLILGAYRNYQNDRVKKILEVLP